jgi:hypothetical protein
MNTSPKTNYDQKRARLIKMVHIAANELGLLNPKRHETDPDDEYHLLLRQWNRPGTRQPVTSSTQMSTAQLGELYRHMKRLGFRVRRREQSAERRESKPHAPSPMRYASSLQGLREEIVDLAKQRWGADRSWEQPLNNFCRRFGISKWQWLDVAHGKEVKAAIIRLRNAECGMRNENQTGATESTEDTEKDEVPF